MPTTKGQTARLADFFRENPNVEHSAVVLHRVGAGNPEGWCASLSRRLSDLRAAPYSLNIVKTKDETVNNQRQTGYTYFEP